jgi:hypothetical protein
LLSVNQNHRTRLGGIAMWRVSFALFFFFLVSTSEAAHLDLAWDLNQETDLAGYRVYYGTSSGEYINFVDVGNTSSYRLDNLLEDVTFYVALTAYDVVGNESDYSVEVSGVGINDPPADPVIDLGVTDVSAPDSATQTETVGVAVVAENLGTQDAGGDITLIDETEGVVIGIESSGTIPPGAFATLRFSWDTSRTLPGSHSLKANHNLSDANPANDSATAVVTVTEPVSMVSVEGMTPDIIQVGTRLNVTITGSGFMKGSDVIFTNGFGPSPEVYNIDVIDSETIVASVTTKKGGPPRDRAWDVCVTNPSGLSAVLAEGLTVRP